ncbi:MAG: nucleotidyl transferase AbiEii/AbiGii toxin family protein, partial [Thermoplasmata archaeon]|nr:nucleotidyl transferase AbiEii/AbiGii toxin family protein [Thermoplasmata archaeon]
IEQLVDETGFNGDLLEKTYNLSRILNALSENDTIRENLVLKGGTSLNLLYLDLPRLSVDLDFNFIGSIDKKEMLDLRSVIEKELKRTSEDLGYGIKNKGSSYIISRDLFTYERTTGLRDHVKVEINYLQRLPLSTPVIMGFRSIFPDLPRSEVITYPREELCAQKVNACIDRWYPRDIFDVFQFSQMKLDMARTRRMTAAYYCMNNDSEEFQFPSFGPSYDLEFYQKLKQLLSRRSSLSYGPLVAGSISFMKGVFNFDSRTRQFIKRFYSEGVIDSDLIFPEGPDLSSHPSLLYQLEQIGK